MAVHHDKHLFGVHDSTYTYGEGSLGYFIDIVVEETAVGDDGVGRQLFLTGAAGEGRTRFVEGDMAVRTDTSEEEVDTADIADLLLIPGALCHEIFGIAVQDIDILFADVDMAEEVSPHEAMVTLRMFFGQVNILVHVEGDYIAEGDLTGFVEFDQGAVHTERRRACRKTQHKRFALFGLKLIDTFC